MFGSKPTNAYVLSVIIVVLTVVKVGLRKALAFSLLLVPFWWQGCAIANLILVAPVLWVLRYDYPRSSTEILVGIRSGSES